MEQTSRATNTSGERHSGEGEHPKASCFESVGPEPASKVIRDRRRHVVADQFKARPLCQRCGRSPDGAEGSNWPLYDAFHAVRNWPKPASER
jgi:hypothetical protein